MTFHLIYLRATYILEYLKFFSQIDEICTEFLVPQMAKHCLEVNKLWLVVAYKNSLFY